MELAPRASFSLIVNNPHRNRSACSVAEVKEGLSTSGECRSAMGLAREPGFQVERLSGGCGQCWGGHVISTSSCVCPDASPLPHVPSRHCITAPQGPCGFPGPVRTRGTPPRGCLSRRLPFPGRLPEEGGGWLSSAHRAGGAGPPLPTSLQVDGQPVGQSSGPGVGKGAALRSASLVLGTVLYVGKQRGPSGHT